MFARSTLLLGLCLFLWHAAPSQSAGITCEELWRRFDHHSCNADDLTKRCQRIYRRLGIKDCLAQGNAQEATTLTEAPETTTLTEAPETTTLTEAPETTTLSEAPETTTLREASETATLDQRCPEEHGREVITCMLPDQCEEIKGGDVYVGKWCENSQAVCCIYDNSDQRCPEEDFAGEVIACMLPDQYQRCFQQEHGGEMTNCMLPDQCDKMNGSHVYVGKWCYDRQAVCCTYDNPAGECRDPIDSAVVVRAENGQSSQDGVFSSESDELRLLLDSLDNGKAVFVVQIMVDFNNTDILRIKDGDGEVLFVFYLSTAATDPLQIRPPTRVRLPLRFEFTRLRDTMPVTDTVYDLLGCVKE